ncbi:MAG TPA: GH116 family glycosyl-hydrolase, partial [Candidatus Limnocylindrales bacterium]
MSGRAPNDWPAIPEIAWRRGIGVPPDHVGHPRVTVPMIDDGPWAGVPIGGIGAGSIGRTYRGDFRRWHLTIGEHRVESVPIDGFAIRVAGGGQQTTRVLSAAAEPGGPGWGPGIPAGAGSYHALFPRAWFSYDLDGLPVRITEEQMSPVIPGDYDSSALPLGLFTWSLENRSSGDQSVALLFTWLDQLDCERGIGRPTHAESCAADGAAGVRLMAPAGPDGMPASLAIAAAADDGVTTSVRRSFPLAAAGDVWADFADDGLLSAGLGARGVDPEGARGVAVAARVELAPGERRTLRFALAWDLPFGLFGSGRRLARRYTRRFGTDGASAFEIAAEGLRRGDEWRSAIDAWQAPVLADPE